MKLYLVRHGESENNALWSSTGTTKGRVPDPELTETGHKQAQLLADHLADANIFEKCGIYEETVDGAKAGLPGPDREYFENRFPKLELPAVLGHGGWYNRPFETNEIFLRRSSEIILDLKRRHEDTDDCVAMIVHGDLIDQLINEVTGAGRHPENYANYWEANWAFHNTSITRIDFISGSRVIVYTNRLQHLPPELVTR